ncbi:MAG: FecR domain-containing protein [Bacteroidota bacterium]
MNQPPYNQYSVEALAEDTHFREWVRNPKMEGAAFWEAASKKNDAFSKKIQQAKLLVQKIDQHYQKQSPDRAHPDPHFTQLLSNVVRFGQAEQKAKLSRRRFTRRWAVAASIALLLGLGTWWATQKEVTEEQWIVHQTDFGEWKKVELPDGSLVHLNAHTELKTKTNWTEGQDRQVWLEGEAFFEVEKKPTTKAKFTVVTEALEVEVLGTKFNVNAQATNTKVFLEEGKIQLKTINQSLELQPNDFIDYTLGQTQLAVTEEKVSTTWKEGTLILEEKTVAEILQKLETIYGYSFEVEQKSLLKEQKTIAVPLDRLEVMLPIIERTLGVKSVKVGEKILLK